jgi:hypothetical protein
MQFNGKLILNHVNYNINSRIKELIPKIPPGHSLVTAYKAGLIREAPKYVKILKRSTATGYTEYQLTNQLK